MKELLSVVTRKGQITVPAQIRRALNLREGDKVALSVPEPESPHVRLRPVRSVAEMTFGALKGAGRRLSVREEREAFEEGVAEEVLAETPPTSAKPG